MGRLQTTSPQKKFRRQLIQISASDQNLRAAYTNQKLVLLLPIALLDISITLNISHPLQTFQ